MVGILIFGAHRLPAAAGQRPAQRRFPHHPGARRRLPGRQPGDHGLGGGHAAGEAVLHHRRHRLDDLDQRAGHDPDHAAVRARAATSTRAAQDVQAAIAAAARQLPPDMPTPPTVPEGQPGRFADPLPRAQLRHAAAVARWTNTPRPCWRSASPRSPGVAQVQVFGAQKYAVRVQARSRRRWPRAASASTRSQAAVQAGNVNLPTGTLVGREPGLHRPGQRPAHRRRRLPPADRRLSQRRAGAPRATSAASSTAWRTTRSRRWFNDEPRASCSPSSASPAPTPSRWSTRIKPAAAELRGAAARRRSTSTVLYDRSPVDPRLGATT